MTNDRKLAAGIVERAVLRVRDGNVAPSVDDDPVVVEEPLEIRVAGEPLAVTMRTPGDDHRLAVGFLFAEGIIASMKDVGSVAHCGRPGEEGFGNAIDITAAPGTVLDPDRLAASRRGTLTTAACGVCGRQRIDDLKARCTPIAPGRHAPSLAVVRDSTARLRERQPNFDRTGGIHAAAAFTADGRLLAAAEDVGRHNAVDKVVGALLYDGLAGEPGTRSDSEGPALLTVSGRISFEIIQKAAVAGIGAVAGVSAPTSLAIDLAHAIGITLAGFVRRGELNLYSHAERVGGEPCRSAI